MNVMSLNMTEAGKLYGVSRWVIQDWVRAGLPYIPTGRKHKRILASTLEAWLKSRQITAKGAKIALILLICLSACSSAPIRRPCEFTLKVKVMTDMNSDFECRRLGVRRHDNGDFVTDTTILRGCAPYGTIITNGDEFVGGHELKHAVEANCK